MIRNLILLHPSGQVIAGPEFPEKNAPTPSYEEWSASYRQMEFWLAVEKGQAWLNGYAEAEKSKSRKKGAFGMELDCAVECRWMNRFSRQQRERRRKRSVDEWLELIWEIADRPLRTRVGCFVAWDYLLDRVGPLADLEDLITDDIWGVPCVEIARELVRLEWTPVEAFARVYRAEGQRTRPVTAEEIKEHSYGLLSVV